MPSDRYGYFGNCLSLLAGSTVSDVGADSDNARALDEFIDDPHRLLLHASVSSNGAKVALTTSLDTGLSAAGEGSTGVAFVKRRPCQVNTSAAHEDVQVVSTSDSPIESLHRYLRSMFNPLLLKNEAFSEKVPPPVQALLADVEARLGGLAHDADAEAEAQAQGGDENSFANILTPSDEIDFWASPPSRSKLDRDAKNEINDATKSIADEFARLETLSWDEAEALVGLSSTALNKIWMAGHVATRGRFSYPQPRMTRVIEVFSDAFCMFVLAKLRPLAAVAERREDSPEETKDGGGTGPDKGKAATVWVGDYNHIRTELHRATDLMDKWADVPSELIDGWEADDESPGRQWIGEKPSLEYAINVKTRIEQVADLRTTFEQLQNLLKKDQARDVMSNAAQIFEPFHGLNPFLYNKYTQDRWDRAVGDFDKALLPAERLVADAFRQQVAPLWEQPTLVLSIFSRSQELLVRAGVRSSLAAERAKLVTALVQHVDALEAAWDERMHSCGDAGKGNSALMSMSPAVERIVLSRQMAGRAETMLSSCQQLFSRDEQRERNFAQFSSAVEALSERAEREEREDQASWTDDLLDKLGDEELSMSMKGQLVDIDHEGIIRVNYQESLVRLLREVRQLTELGLNVDPSILAAATTGESYYRFGVQLKKVANFYNTMETQIIAEQRPMMLDVLVSFETAINRQNIKGGKITWGTPTECENYVARLMQKATAIEKENAELRRAHDKLSSHVVSLLQIDLLRQRELWKAQWGEIMQTLNGLKAKYPAERMGRWLRFWDEQIYKAIEASYKTGLETLNENLQTEGHRVELVFAHGMLQLKPSMEDLRQLYYREMKKFISFPNKFQGLGNASVYQRMAPSNMASLVRVYENAETLFAKLAALCERYRPWVILGSVGDVHSYVEERVTELSAYEANFKMIKVRRKEQEKLADSEKVDCFKVSLLPLKAAVDEQLSQLHEALVINLRRQLLAEFKTVDTFLSSSMEKLSARPHTIEEISESQKEWKEIEQEVAGVKATSLRAVEKKALFATTAPQCGIDTGDVVMKMANLDGQGGRWDEFEVAMETFNYMIEEQKETLKGFLDEQVVEVNQNIEKFAQRWAALKPTDMAKWDREAIDDMLAQLDKWETDSGELSKAASELAENRESFNMAPARFEGLDALKADLATTISSWGMIRQYMDELAAIAETDWISFRNNIYALADLGTAWYEKARARYTAGTHDMVTDHIMAEVEKIKLAMPALKYCHGKDFKDEHWSALLQGKLQLQRGVRLDNLNVGHFISSIDALCDPKLMPWVKDLQARANGEVLIREALDELTAWSQVCEFKLIEHEEAGRRTPLISAWKDMFLDLGDKQSLLASLKESPFYRAFEDRGSYFEDKMVKLDTYLHLLNSIQRKWVYLEPIFERGALPSEQRRFRGVDEFFRTTMDLIEKDLKLFTLCDEMVHNMLGEELDKQHHMLELCQKALADFLEEKRNAFPRFYFIGDDDLLEILGQAKNPVVIQSHLKKLYQGVNAVAFNDDNSQIVAMISSAGERVELKNPIHVTALVEEWLVEFTDEMKETLASLLNECLDEGSDLKKFPSQILNIAEYIRFTGKAEAAVEDGGRYKSLRESLNDKRKEYTGTDLSTQRLLQLKVQALVLDLVHNMDVVDQLEKSRIRTLDEWQWQKQLRYYPAGGGPRGDLCQIRMSDATFDYTYEYQGNAMKLVHTPLTDKCYLTLTSAMHMGMGGNPYGPAGTGKTESVKALGNAFGRQVLVFNCDEGIDFQSMGRIFIGLVKCGAWGCFDEFNRLLEDQLSAISQQIQVIQDAIKTKRPAISLLGRTFDVDFNAGIFVTLNPAGKDYGGRSNLPDNLKALFRPIAMGRPDNDLIAEVILFSEGFASSKSLSTKIVSLFTLSKELLSPQRHYDWGLRALKAVLNTGGKLCRTAMATGKGLDDRKEAELLIKAVRVNTLSKLTFDDSRRFIGMIGDMFPGVASGDMDGGQLEATIREVMVEKPFNLQLDETQIKKMLQLKEALDQRMGCVVVGPSGCGKSTVWRVLQAAMVKCGQTVKTYVMNPKSMPRQRLLGHMDLDTREWADGVLTDAARQVVKEPSEIRSWIVCDGDVDPEWVESLNSVLDDNHLLTMPNGERISFGDNVNFLFETHDLRFASPATVSRMGMIFLSEDDIDVKRVTIKWLNTQPAELQPMLGAWLDDLFFKALDKVVTMELVVETTLVGTVLNGLTQCAGATSKGEFVCGLIRGLGGNLGLADRSSFAKELFDMAGERPPDIGAPLDCSCQGAGGYRAFANASFDRAEAIPGETPVVTTVSVQRAMAMIAPWVEQMQPFILVGPEGCGKSMVILHAFGQRKNTNVTTLHCSAQTTAEHVITKISQSCSLFSTPEGRVYRPKDCERLVLYLKDLNLPKPDMYDTCMLIAFLQQLITFGGFYDENLEFLRLERIQIVASMNPATTVGRHPLSTRFTATVRIGVLDFPDKAELVHVYDALLTHQFVDASGQSPSSLDAQARTKLATTMVEVYEQTRAKFTVDDARHYLFTPRDVTAWVDGLGRYNLAADALVEVVAYEARRLFADRLIDAEACGRFDSLLMALLRSQWRYSPSPGAPTHYFSSIAAPPPTDEELKNKQGPSNVSGRRLARVTGEDFLPLVKKGLMMYEREYRDLNILLFDEVLDHIAQVERVLSRDCGHLLLVGRAGVGRRTATTLVANMLGYAYHEPAVTRGFDSKAFNADLKSVMVGAGVEGTHTVLYLEDHLFASDAILETVNSLLASGEVPGLFTNEELEPLLGPLKQEIVDEGLVITGREYFYQRVRAYLHVCVGMDPTNSGFVVRCESNPAFYTRCSILWMGDWRRASLRRLPCMMDGVRDLVEPPRDDAAGDEVVGGGGAPESKGSRGEGKGGGGGGEGKGSRSAGAGEGKGSRSAGAGGGGEGKGARSKSPLNGDMAMSDHFLTEAVVTIHETCCTEYAASPREFVAFLQCWHTLFQKNKGTVMQSLNNLSGGLGKLQEAAETVDELSKKAVVQKVELAEAQVAADQAMDEITKALTSSSHRREEVSELENEVREKTSKTNDRKGEIEGELEGIKPVLEASARAVGMIKSEHLNEIRSLKMPPEPIADVLGAVLKLLGIHDVSWLSMKKFLGNRGVKDEILNFDAHRITPEIRKDVTKLLQAKRASFDRDTITRVSVAAAPLAEWVKANIRYSIVLEKIQPLEAELSLAQEALDTCQSQLKVCQEDIAAIDERVAKLKSDFTSKTREAEMLRAALETAQNTLDKAERLIGQLSGERLRWEEQTHVLRGQVASLPKRMLLAAGFMTYLAKTPEDARARAIEQWLQVTKLEVFELTRELTTESQLLVWKQMGLASDTLSQENALVITNAHRTPFIVDPADAATAWLTAVLGDQSGGGAKSQPLEVVPSADERFVSRVEQSVRFGKTLLITNVDGLEPLLYGLVRKDLSHQGPRMTVQLGERALDYNENFSLYLATADPDPNIPPDAAALLSVVNFTVTRSGLEGQLLGITIQHEQPELEKQKTTMLKQEEDFKVQLAELEAQLLEALASAEGNILDNVVLLESLTKTKETSAQIGESLDKSAEASIELDAQRETYRPFARDGSKIFFLVSSLKSISPMYRFSLNSFITDFVTTLDDEDCAAGSLDARLGRLTPAITTRVLYSVGRALFKADRLMFAMHLVHGMHDEQMRPKEWEAFTGELGTTLEGRAPAFPSWAKADRAPAFNVIAEHFPRLIQELDLTNVSRWRRWADSAECERDFPNIRNLTPFQRVLIVKALRPDRLLSTMGAFASEVLGCASISPPPMTLKQMWEGSTNERPILLVTSGGADPSRELEEYAASQVGEDRYADLPMGGGQQPVALEMLATSMEEGSWLCLKNLHLVVAWLPTLEKLLQAAAGKTSTHRDFRLWLTTEPHRLFPTILLQSSIKLTFESPPGVKKNMQRTFTSWGDEFVNSGDETRHGLLYVLAFFHAVVQERRTYIPQGWSKFYEFSVGDIRAGRFVMDAIATLAESNKGNADFTTLHGKMEDAIYGSRCESEPDTRVVRAYLGKFFNSRTVAGDEDLTRGVRVPTGGGGTSTFDAFMAEVGRLGDVDAPAMFGLPDNIERSVQRTESGRVIKQLSALSRAAVEGGKFDRDKWRVQLGPVLDMWAKLSDGKSLSSASGGRRRGKAARGKGGGDAAGAGDDGAPPTSEFVQMEEAMACKLCAAVENGIAALKKVLYGSALLTPAVQSVAMALLAGNVPKPWSKTWEGPEKPMVWLKTLVTKRQALKGWVDKVAANGLLEAPLLLADLFRPGTFLNALRQQTARELKVPMDGLKLATAWEGKRIRAPLVVTVSELLLQGAEFDGTALREAAPTAPEVTSAPPLFLAFVPADEGASGAGESVAVPVYETTAREKLLFEADVPCGRGSPADWVLSGCALLVVDEA